MNKDEIIKEFLSNAGKKGGSVKSEAKAKAARENGKKGGRPRKGGTENV
jgi:general stress protein YciG